MNRRALLTMLVGATVAQRQLAVAQPIIKRPLVAILWWGSDEMEPGRTYLREILAGLREFGYQLARIMHDAGVFCTCGRRARRGDPSDWTGVRLLAVQRVWG